MKEGERYTGTYKAKTAKLSGHATNYFHFPELGTGFLFLADDL